MNVALFGGTFDPIHRGHLAIARAAAERFKLGRIYFVPADIPPHKQKQPLTPYYHRYAMVALALAGEKNFIPALLEAPEIIQAEGKLASYSIDTVLRFKQSLKKSDRLFFLIGIDAFMDITKWHSPVQLLKECEFIVASRPGFSLADVARALPEEMRPEAHVSNIFRGQKARGELVLSGTTIHFLDDVQEAVSATKVRAAAAKKRSVANMTGEAVADYIRKQNLYRPGAEQLPAQEEESGQTPGLRIVGGREHKKKNR